MNIKNIIPGDILIHPINPHKLIVVKVHKVMITVRWHWSTDDEFSRFKINPSAEFNSEWKVLPNINKELSNL